MCLSSTDLFVCVFGLQVKRSFGLCSLQLTYLDEENEEVREFVGPLALAVLTLRFEMRQVTTSLGAVKSHWSTVCC